MAVSTRGPSIRGAWFLLNLEDEDEEGEGAADSERRASKSAKAPRDDPIYN